MYRLCWVMHEGELFSVHVRERFGLGRISMLHVVWGKGRNDLARAHEIILEWDNGCLASREGAIWLAQDFLSCLIYRGMGHLRENNLEIW